MNICLRKKKIKAVKSTGADVRHLGSNLAPLLTNWVSLGELFYFSIAQFPYL